MIKQGIEGLGRWGEIFLPILLFIIFMALILSIPNLKADNILPVLEDGITPVIKGTISTFSFPMAETVLFTLVLSSLKSTKDAYRTYILAIIFAGGVILISSIRNTMVLGTYIISLNYYLPLLLWLG
jgi:spore germination protein KB